MWLACARQPCRYLRKRTCLKMIEHTSGHYFLVTILNSDDDDISWSQKNGMERGGWRFQDPFWIFNLPPCRHAFVQGMVQRTLAINFEFGKGSEKEQFELVRTSTNQNIRKGLIDEVIQRVSRKKKHATKPEWEPQRTKGIKTNAVKTAQQCSQNCYRTSSIA